MTAPALAARLTEILGYKAPAEIQSSFDLLHRHVYGRDGGLKRDERRPTGEPRERYLTFVRCCVSAVPKAFRACMLRRDSIADLERLAGEAIHEAYKATPGSSGSGSIGDTIRYDADYHAFLFGYRACLDYFDLGIRSYFEDTQKQRPTFADYSALLKRLKREPASGLWAAFDSHQARLHFAFGPGAQRNRAAHQEFLKPAHVIAVNGALRLAGGGEEVELAAGASLAEILSARLVVLNSFLLASFEAIAQIDWP